MNMRQEIIKTDAFRNVSFDPEKRIERFANDFESGVREIEEKCKKYGVDPERLVEKYFKLAMDYLSSESRCVSWAIAGPANFPVERNNKRVDCAMKKLDRYVSFMEDLDKMLKRITRKKETEDDKKVRWIKKIEELKKHQEMMKDVNALVRKGKVEEAYMKYGLPVEKNCWGNYGFESYELRNNLANIKRLEQQIKQIDKTRENKAETGFEFDGGRVEFDAEEIRYNIFFDSVPYAELRAKLKSYGFKWSPRRGAWTRGAKTIRVEPIKNILKG